jgi:hypothetical protein
MVYSLDQSLRARSFSVGRMLSFAEHDTRRVRTVRVAP